jgi:hypothetical protein
MTSPPDDGKSRAFSSRLVLLVAALSAGSAPGLRADTYPRQPGLAVLHYVFDLALPKATGELVVTAPAA